MDCTDIILLFFFYFSEVLRIIFNSVYFYLYNFLDKLDYILF